MDFHEEQAFYSQGCQENKAYIGRMNTEFVTDERLKVSAYRISIVVPVYNTEKYLMRCVKSLRDQSYANLEILLVDDGSTDESGRLCDEMAREDERLRVIHKENGGLVSAWKRGVSESRGAYISFVDSDDWIDSNMIEEMAVCLTGNQEEIIASDYVIEKENGDRRCVWQQIPPGEYGREEIERKVIPNLLGKEKRYVTISRCMKLIGRRLIERNMEYSNSRTVFGEDMTLILPSLIDCQRLVIMDKKAYYHYFYVNSSMVHKYDGKLLRKINFLREAVQNIVKDKFSKEELKKRLRQADQEHIFMLLLVLKNEARGNPKGYRENILSICRDPEVRQLCRETPVEVREAANRLLYLVLRHPNGITVSFLRLAMLIYYH